MTDIPNDPTMGGDPGNLGSQSVRMDAISAKLKVDADEIRKLIKPLQDVREVVKGLTQDLADMGDAVDRATTPGGKGGKMVGGTPRPPQFEDKVSGSAKDVGNEAALQGRSWRYSRAGAMGGGTGIGTGGSFQGFRAFANSFGGPKVIGLAGLASLGAMLSGATDTRILRGAEYASGADKLTVLMQQITGMSQRQVIQNMRIPLTNYRLGPGGINDLLAFQAQTGFAATPQLARSIAGISASTGYSKGTADILADQRALLDPNVANRMWSQLGINALGIGGKMKDPMTLRKQLVQVLGLNNSLILRGAAAPGSVTRARMTMAGIPQEMADDLIQYAKENQQFRAKGGTGMYDPSKEEDRKRMGIEGNLSTQQKETERLRIAREEQFYKTQAGALAAGERADQTMIRLLTSIDDTLARAYGARARASGWARLGGQLGKIGGIALAGIGAATGAGPLIPIGIGMAAAGSAVGDPVAGDSPKADATISVPSYGRRITLDSLKTRGDFRQLNPKMQDRLLRMFRTNPNVGLGQGARSSDQQRSMFLQRYRKTSKETNIWWDGSYWEHVSGAAAAPPGKSMHEVGLAADLVGDMGWVAKHASEFGLKEFSRVNNEPWHVQPAELPSSRRDYEASGSPWGGMKAPADTPMPNGKPAPDILGDTGSGGLSGGSIGSYTGMTISQIIEAMHNESLGLLGSASPSTSASNVGKNAIATAQRGSAATGGKLTAAQVAHLAYNAGFRGQDLINMVAIAYRESGGWNPRAYNGNEKTGDHSYGLWQINTLNKPGAGMMGNLVNDILGLPHTNANFDALFDPATNARVAFEFYKRNGNTLRPWGGYKGKTATFGINPEIIFQATDAVHKEHLGDPMPPEVAHRPEPRGSTQMVVHSSPVINVNPTINFYGVPQTTDLRKIASTVGQLLQDEARVLELRSA